MSFTWFDHFTDIVDACTDEELVTFVRAITAYGTHGRELELEGSFKFAFLAIKKDIDNSINARTKNKGGRPKRAENVENYAADVENYVSKNPKNGGFEDKNPGFEPENGGFEVGNGGFEPENGGFEVENPSLYTKPNQTKLNQSKPYQTKPNQEGKRARAGAQAGDDDARFIADALDIFNAETGLDVRDLTPEAMLGLQRIRGSGRTLEDVRRVVRAKRDQWSGNSRMRSYIRPSTLFGERFEEYFAETGKAVSAYAEYD